MNINVIGLGYVGLPTAIMIASEVFLVTGSDLNTDLIEALQNHNKVIDDVKLQSLMESKIGKCLKFDLIAIKADYHFIAVPTPFVTESKKVDLVFIKQVIDELLLLDQKEFRIVIESTISPGTIDNLKKEYLKFNKRIIFFHAPERILPGNTYNELIHNDRVIGVDHPEDASELIEIYQTFCKGEIIVTDIKTAELSKVVENAYRDVNIAFANEIARISFEMGVDVTKLIEITNKHPRVNILKPGPGVGGHCIPIDPWFLVGDFPHLTNVIASSRKSNDLMPKYIAERILNICKKENIALNRIGVYGLTYKADVADFRESPSHDVIKEFSNLADTKLVSYDPYVENNSEQSSFENFIDSIDLLVILVSHKHIKERLNQIENKLIFDIVNIVNRGNVIKL